MDPRQVRGRLLAESQDKRIKHVEGPLWFVPSQREGGYLVNVAAGSCGCPDFQQHPTKCKHLWAVELVRSGGKPEAKEGDAETALVKAAPPKLGRASDFTAQQEEHIRRALRFMAIRSGGWGPLAKALRLTDGTLIHAAGRQKVSARVALRLAQFAGVSVEDMMAGKYPPEGTCPHCGHRPPTAQ